MSLILDCSVTLAWSVAEEQTPAILAVADQVRKAGAWVPSLWRLEVAKLLEMGVRRKRFEASFRDDTLADLDNLPIRIDPDTDRQAWGPTVRLAARLGLSVYDACYLELAKRRDLPLATLDRDLRIAATAEGVALMGV